jgi:hypothetical protein
MFNSVTKEDFVRTGKRFNPESMISVANRLLPLATADIAKLSAGGFTPGRLAELVALRARASDLIAASRSVRSVKAGARAGEDVMLEEARSTLMQGLTLACMTLTERKPAPGESAEANRERLAELNSSLKALGRSVVVRAPALLTRLIGLRELLRDAAFAPSAEEAPAREAFLAGLDTVIAGITSQAECKKALRDQSKDMTSQVAEATGRLYIQLRLLCQLGKAVFRRADERDHARSYSMWELRQRGAKPAEGAAGAPVVPMPAPAADPIQPAVNG